MCQITTLGGIFLPIYRMHGHTLIKLEKTQVFNFLNVHLFMKCFGPC